MSLNDANSESLDTAYATDLTVDNLKILQSFNVLNDLTSLAGGTKIKVGELMSGKGTVSNNKVDLDQKMSYEYYTYLYAASNLTNIVTVFVQENIEGELPGTLKLSVINDAHDSTAKDLCKRLELPQGTRLSFGVLSNLIFFIIDKVDHAPFQQIRYKSLLWESQKQQRTVDTKERVRAIIGSEELSHLPFVTLQPSDERLDEGGGMRGKFPYFIAAPDLDSVEEQIISTHNHQSYRTFDVFVETAVTGYKTTNPDPKAFDPLSWLKEFDSHYMMFTLQNQKLLADTNIEDVISLQPNALQVIAASDTTEGFVLSFYGTCNGKIYPVCWMTDDFSKVWREKSEKKEGTAKQHFFDMFEVKIPDEINIKGTFLAAIESHDPYERKGQREELQEADIKAMYEKKNKTPELFFFLMKGPYGTSYPVFVVKDLKQKVDPQKIANPISSIYQFTDSFLKSKVKGGKNNEKVWSASAAARVVDMIAKTKGMEEENRNELRYLGNGIGIQAPPTKLLDLDTKPDLSSFITPEHYNSYKPKDTDKLPIFDPEQIHKQFYSMGHSRLYKAKEDRNEVESIKNSKVVHPIPRACAEMPKLTTVDLTKAESISTLCFENCKVLSKVVAPKVTKIGASAFYGCNKLIEVNLRHTESIGEFAFGLCSSLKSIKFPKLKTIGGKAFNGCTELATFEEPTIVEEIGDGAFMSCVRMKALPKCIHKYTKRIGKNAFYHAGSSQKPESKKLILDKVEGTIGDRAFERCDMFQSLELKLVTSIGMSTFQSCKQLQILYLHKVTHIGNYAFMHCTSLKSVNAKNITTIGREAFFECSVLEKFNATNLKEIGDGAFGHCSKVKIVRKQFAEFQYLGIGAFNNAPNIEKLTRRERINHKYDSDKIEQIRKAYTDGEQVKQKLLDADEKKAEKINDILMKEVEKK